MQARPALLFAAVIAIGAGGGVPAAQAATLMTTAAALSAGGETILDQGEATWYGGRHQGLRTFSGERFDKNKLTAAHPSLPIGTMVRVTDVATGRSIIVRVNDREPPHGVRCIDLSEGAAMLLGIHGRGVAEVTLTSVAPDAAEAAPVEVAEAPDDAVAPDASGALRAGRRQVPASARHGRQHRHHAAR